MLVNVSDKETGELLQVDSDFVPDFKLKYNHASWAPFILDEVEQKEAEARPLELLAEEKPLEDAPEEEPLEDAPEEVVKKGRKKK